MKTKWVATDEFLLLGMSAQGNRVIASKPGAVLIIEGDSQLDLSFLRIRVAEMRIRKNKNETPPARNLFSEN